MPVFERAQKLRRSRSCIAPSCGRCPCCAGRVGAAGAFAVVNVPVIIQRQVRFSSTAEVPQIQFTARVVDILLCNRDWYEAFIRGVMVAVIGFFDAFCVIFRAPPVIPELSASFSSFRALTPVSARGLQRVCQLITMVLWTYTLS